LGSVFSAFGAGTQHVLFDLPAGQHFDLSINGGSVLLTPTVTGAFQASNDGVLTFNVN
jgi:hypothetical protein